MKPGLAEWETFDADVLGGNYHGHFPTDRSALVEVADSAAHHPILAGIPGSSQWTTNGALYRVTPLRDRTTVLMYGQIEGQPAEPVAWTHSYRGGRVFYTSLGHPDDFDNDGFNRMLVGAVFWCLRLDPPDGKN
jgi:type 1 glutamine amidotransferase